MEREFDPDEPELMDLPQPVSEELRRDLANLASLNKWFGAYGIVDQFMRPWWRRAHRWQREAGERSQDDVLTILDLCTGAGDIPRHLMAKARLFGVRVRVMAVDFQAATLEIASSWSTGFPEIEFRRADVLDDAEPLPEADLVLCSLALHHFSEQDAVRLLRRCRRQARCAALVADLERRQLTRVGVGILTSTLYRDPMTVADARTSARRAFSRDEFGRLLDSAGWSPRRQKSTIFGRQWASWESLASGN